MLPLNDEVQRKKNKQACGTLPVNAALVLYDCAAPQFVRKAQRHPTNIDIHAYSVIQAAQISLLR